MHHSCSVVRIFICSMARMNMKRIAEITFCFIVLIGIEVSLSTLLSISNNDSQVFTEIRCSGIIQKDYWNSGFADDNEVEIKCQCSLIVIGEKPIINYTADILSRPKQPCFLNPLFSDRPPPYVCT